MDSVIDLSKHHDVMVDAFKALLNENDSNIKNEIKRAIADCIETNELTGKERLPAINITGTFTLNIVDSNTIDIVPKIGWGHKNKKEASGDRIRIDNTPKII